MRNIPHISLMKNLYARMYCLYSTENANGDVVDLSFVEENIGESALQRLSSLLTTNLRIVKQMILKNQLIEKIPHHNMITTMRYKPAPFR